MIRIIEHNLTYSFRYIQHIQASLIPSSPAPPHAARWATACPWAPAAHWGIGAPGSVDNLSDMLLPSGENG